MTVYAYCCLPQDNNGPFWGISVFDSRRLCHWLPSGSPHCNLNQIVSIMGLFISTSWAEWLFVPASCCVKNGQVAYVRRPALLWVTLAHSWWVDDVTGCIPGTVVSQNERNICEILTKQDLQVFPINGNKGVSRNSRKSLCEIYKNYVCFVCWGEWKCSSCWCKRKVLKSLLNIKHKIGFKKKKGIVKVVADSRLRTNGLVVLDHKTTKPFA